MSSIVCEIKCSIFDTKLTQKKKLYEHLRNIHGSDSLAVNNCIYTVCEKKTFKVQKTLDSHIKKYHTNSNGHRETRIICPYECNEPLFKYSKLRIHLFEKHNITIEVIEIRFLIIAEFEKWKTEKEQKTFSKFILNRASKKLCNGSTRSYYYCHRSFNNRKTKNEIEKARETKSIGSNKIDGKCLAMIKLTVSECEETVEIEFIKTDETCTHSSCLTCKKCNICIHTFHCSCIDNIIKANICKHIHACAREFVSLDDNTENIVFQDSNMTEQKVLMDMVATSSHHKAHKNQTIMSQTEIISGLSTTSEYSNENLQKIEKILAEVIAIMNEGEQTHLKVVEEVNVQKQIDPQLQLYSTKKKTSIKTSIAKLSVNEVNVIISGLNDDNNETINVHNVFDHSHS